MSVTRGRSAGRWTASAALAIGIALVLAVRVNPAAAAATSPGSAHSTGSTATGRAAVSQAAAVTGSFGIRLVHDSSQDVSDPRGYFYIVSAVTPGTVVHRQLEVGNDTSGAGHFLAYAAAASLSNGQFVGAVGRTQNQLSSWVHVTPAAPSLRSGAVAAIDATITVPRNAAPGIRYGVVWAQVQVSGGAGISAACRVGIRIYFTVLRH